MEKTRTLPPLVRGKVTGVLDVLVEDINLKCVFLPIDNSYLVLQVQWWGEDSPTYIRPKKSCGQQARIISGSDLEGMHLGSARYEIKTTLDLFKLYLRTSEVLELCVLDVLDNCIIGSACLRDLVNLLNKRNNIITLPVVDYLGDEIGEVLVVFNFVEKFWQEEEKICVDLNTCNRVTCARDLYAPNKLKKNNSSSFRSAETNFYFDRNKLINKEDLSNDFQLSIDKDIFSEINKFDYARKCDGYSINSQKPSRSNKKLGERETFYKSLPEVTVSSDLSKVLYFGLNSHKSKLKTDKNPKTGVTSKFNSNSIKCKSKNYEKSDSFPFKNSSVDRKQIKKSVLPKESDNLQNKPAQAGEIKKPAVILANKSVQSEEQLNYQEAFVQNPPAKESPKSKVLDYLLGTDLTKQDEETAVNEFKRMSPSHNLVTSINKLCLTSDSDSFKSKSKDCISTLAIVQHNHLNFNLNDPIERDYYEKFFLKSNPSFDLELAEFLNQPESRFAFENLKSNECKLNKSVSYSSQSSKLSLSEKGKSEENILAEFNSGNVMKDCARCKYYKKLEELDAIIESLKHFERKMLSDERDMTSALIGNEISITNQYMNS